MRAGETLLIRGSVSGARSFTLADVRLDAVAVVVAPPAVALGEAVPASGIIRRPVALVGVGEWPAVCVGSIVAADRSAVSVTRRISCVWSGEWLHHQSDLHELSRLRD